MQIFSLSFANARARRHQILTEVLADAAQTLGYLEGRQLFFWHAGRFLGNQQQATQWLQQHAALIPLWQRLVQQGIAFFRTVRANDGSCYSVRGFIYPNMTLAVLSIHLQSQYATASCSPDGRFIERTYAFDVLWQLNTDDTIEDYNAWLAALQQKKLIIDDKSVRMRLQQYCTTPFAMQREHWMLADGRTILLHFHQQPTGGMRMTCEDLTAALHQKQLLRNAEHELHTVLAALKEGIGVFSSNGVLRLHNPALQHMLKFSPTDVPLRIEKVLAAINAIEPHFVLQLLGMLMGAERRQTHDVVVHYDDETVYRVRAVPLSNGDVLLSMIDYTSEAVVERSLRARLEPLIAAHKPRQRSIEQLAYALRTPLNAVVGFADMVPMLGTCTPKQTEILQSLNTAITDLSHQIDGVIDILDLDSCVAPDLQTGDPRIMVQQAVAQVEQRHLQRNKIIQELDNCARYSESLDLPRVQRALMQLLDNGYKYTPADGVIKVRAVSDEQYFYFIISDNGKGLPPYLQHMGNRRIGEGAGFGLRCAELVCQLHGGTLQMSNLPQGGAQFTMILPRHAPLVSL